MRPRRRVAWTPGRARVPRQRIPHPLPFPFTAPRASWAHVVREQEPLEWRVNRLSVSHKEARRALLGPRGKPLGQAGDCKKVGRELH